MNNRVRILDCTLRDGGLGLEDANINNISDMCFSLEDTDALIDNLRKTKIDIIELGSIEITHDDRRRFGIYKNIQEISKMVPKNRSSNQMYVGLFRGPDTPIEDIPNWNEKMIDGVRVIIRYSELQKSLDFCSALAEKGYKVFVQPMLTMRYTQNELELIVKESNKMGAYAVYFVDSYGYMQNTDVIKYLNFFDQNLAKDICVGFHAHNNMNLAYANSLSFIDFHTQRNIIIDSCMIGMGQGAGNLQTELIAFRLNKLYNNRYDYSAILDACEIIEKYYCQGVWGYSVTRLLPALHNVAYKYALAFRHQYGLRFSEINNLLMNLPNELKHRYTTENLKLILKENASFK